MLQVQEYTVFIEAAVFLRTGRLQCFVSCFI